MAVAGIFTGKLCTRYSEPRPLAGIDSFGCASHCSSSAISPPFSGVVIKQFWTPRRRKGAFVRRTVQLPVVGSQEASASTLLVQEVEFTWKGPGSNVLLTGDFLKWETQVSLEKTSNGAFSVTQKLPLGRYAYKFVVDGEWKYSPDSPTVPDGSGGLNNEITVTDASATDGTKEVGDAPLSLKPINPIERPKASVETPKAKRDTAVSAEKVPKVTGKKPVAKSLEATMLEDVIPLLTRTLEKEEGISDLDVIFEDNQLRVSFSQGGIPYSFWAFFPDGTIEGSRGSSITSHGSPPSTVEPFLVDEKKITPDLLVFWIRKRLVAQKILSELTL